MIDFRVSIISGKHYQKGAVVLMTVTLLLLIVTLTTIYTGRSQTFKHQIIVNNQNHKLAFISANTGMQKMIAELMVNKHLVGYPIIETLADNSSFTLNSNSQNIKTVFGDRKLITLFSLGVSADGLASANITEQVLVYPLLVNKPIAPVIVQKGMVAPNKIEVVVNPNGLGAGVPLSVWSDKEVTLSSVGSATCELAEFNAGNCASKYISNYVTKSTDIQSLSASFPNDLFGYIFNTPLANVNQLQEQANLSAFNCSSLNSASTGLIWVTGNCVVSLGQQLGSLSAPLILVVQDGELFFDKNVTLFGILFSYRTPKVTSKLTIKMERGAKIKGALISNHELGGVSDTIRVVYDDNVLQTLVTQNELQRLARVPGSWKDF